MKATGIPRNGLVGEWLLDSDSNDYSGNGYNGTPSNVIYSNTDVGYNYTAATFNGSTSKILVSGAGNTGAGNRSISCVVDFSSSNDGVIMCEGPSATNNQWGVSTTPSGFIKAYVYGGNEVVSTVSSGKRHVCATYNGTSIALYIDGILIGTNTASINVLTGFVSIGAITSSANFFNGKIQSARCYNRVLQPQEITALYYESKKLLSGKSYNDLFAGVTSYWDFKGDANDVVGGNNLSVSNATLTSNRFSIPSSAYYFNGTNAYMAGPLNLGGTLQKFAVSGSFTIDEAIPNGAFRCIVRKEFCFAVTLQNNAGTVQIRGLNGNGTSWGSTLTAGSLSQGVPYSFVYMVDNTSTYLYINGTQANNGTTTVSGVANNANNMVVGANNDLTTLLFKGTIDDMAIHSAGRTTSECATFSRLMTIETPLPYYRNLPKCLQNYSFRYSGNTSGTTAYDISGNGNNGTLVSSPTFQRKPNVMSTVFNGTSQYATFPNTAQTSLQTFTLSANLMLNATNTGGQTPVRKDTASTRNLWGFKVNPNQTGITAQLYNGTTEYLSTAFTMTLGRRYNVTMTVSGSSGTMKFYVNGGLVSTTSVGAFTAPTDVLSIGSSVTGGFEYWNGQVSDVMLYPRVLSDYEVSLLAKALYVK